MQCRTADLQKAFQPAEGSKDQPGRRGETCCASSAFQGGRVSLFICHCIRECSLLYNSLQLGLEFSRRTSNLSNVLGKKSLKNSHFALVSDTGTRLSLFKIQGFV